MSQQRQKTGLQLLSSKINEKFGIEVTAEQLQTHGWRSWQRPGNRNNYFQNEKLRVGPFINSPGVINFIEAAARRGQKQDVLAMLGHHAVSAVCLSSRCCTLATQQLSASPLAIMKLALKLADPCSLLFGVLSNRCMA